MRKSTRAAISAAAAAAAVVAGMVLATAGPSSAAPADTHAAASSGGVRVAYFDQWSIYANAYYLKNVDAIANNLDYILYDFENIDPSNLTCFEATKASDTGPTGEQNPNAGDGAADQFADYQKTFDSSISVDGTSDTWNMPIVGNFHQLQELKARHPNLKVLVSLGGWTYSKYFSDAAATSASRQKFVSSCIDMFIKGNIPAAGGFGGPGTAAGIFDGFDIDWEYPASPAGHLGNHTSPNDTQNFTALLSEFRSQLNAAGSGYKLSAALPGGQDKVAKIETNKIHQYLDFANVMSYDMHGAWDATGPTNHQDPLYQAPNDPSTPIPPGNEKYSIDGIFNAYINGDPAYGIAGGFPANKLNLGVPFYYRGWTGVQAGANHGLYQAASGPSPGHPMSGNTPGTAMYKELTGLVDNPSTTFYDNATQSAYFYDGNNFYTGESKQSIKARMDYVHCKGLGGAMMFSLYDLDPASTLFHSVVDGLASTPSSCDGPPPTTTTDPTTTTTTTTTTPPPTDCTAAAWVASQAYSGGAVVTYNGHKWTAKWWTQGDTPGNNSQDVWTDNGSC